MELRQEYIEQGLSTEVSMRKVFHHRRCARMTIKKKSFDFRFSIVSVNYRNGKLSKKKLLKDSLFDKKRTWYIRGSVV